MRDICADFAWNFTPAMAISRLVNSLKGVSSRRLRQDPRELAQHYWWANRLWSGCTSPTRSAAPISALRQYVEQQSRPRLTGSRPSARTTGLKADADALADIQVADPSHHASRVRRIPLAHARTHNR